MLAGKAVVQRLDTEAVTCHEQGLPTGVPDGEGKHAVQVLRAVLAPFRVGLEDDLAVTTGEKVITARGQLLAQLRIIVDGAVEHQHQPEFPVNQRLVGTLGQVDDGQSPVPQPNRTIGILACRVRPAPLQTRHHPGQGVMIGLSAIETQFATDAAHGFSSSAARQAIVRFAALAPDREPGFDPPDAGYATRQLHRTLRYRRTVHHAGQRDDPLPGDHVDIDGTDQLIANEPAVDGRGDAGVVGGLAPAVCRGITTFGSTANHHRGTAVHQPCHDQQAQ